MKIGDPSQLRLMEDLNPDFNSRYFGGAAETCVGVVLTAAGAAET